jgi:methyl coenzyme M reductase subunit C
MIMAQFYPGTSQEKLDEIIRKVKLTLGDA